MRHRLVALAALSIAAAGAGRARAQTSGAAELAFREGRQLMNQGRFKEACPKFAESQRLDPAPGTQLNLADCYEKLGLTATAWETFRAAETAATRTGQADFASEARKRAIALEPRLCKLAITAAEPGGGLEVRLDGTPVTRLVGSAMPIDPGHHVVAAAAPGKRPWSRTVEIERPGMTETVEIPALPAAPGATAAPAEPSPTVERRARPAGSSHRMTPLAWGFAIGAGAALAVGVGLDAMAYGDLRACRDRGGCASQDEVDSIKTRFMVGDVLLGAAVASAGAAFLAYWLGGDPDAERSVEVVATPESAAILMIGRF